MAKTDDAEPQAQDEGVVEQNLKHDESLKSLLATGEAIAHFLTKYISQKWTAYVAADKLVRVDTSFITDKFRHIDSDLIYKLQINDSDVYFYILLELQSTVDFKMPFRLLRYMVALLDTVFEDADKDVRERKDYRLPAIVPIVLYNGYDNWTAVRSFREYTKNRELFGDNIINFEYLLFDLKRTDESAILPITNVLDAFLSLDRLRLEKKLSPDEFVRWWSEQAPQLSADDKNTLLNWIKHVMYKGRLSPRELETLTESLKKGDKHIMKHGLAAWRDELIEEATVVATREATHNEDVKIARAMKEAGMNVDTIAKFTGLTVDEILQL
jgi:predicted transposase/invertase (TIGR01784 family)